MIQQSFIDMENMFDLFQQKRQVMFGHYYYCYYYLFIYLFICILMVPWALTIQMELIWIK